MTIDTAYTCWAASYDTDPNATRDLDQSATAEVLGARRFAMAVEAGCGTGKNTPRLDEWWHADDTKKAPRLLTLLWVKRAAAPRY